MFTNITLPLPSRTQGVVKLTLRLPAKLLKSLAVGLGGTSGHKLGGILNLRERDNITNILKLEQEAQKYQESIFGTDGELMKKRLELIQPIQKKVFDTIKKYAEQKGYDMIIDISQNATMLYYSERADHTDEIIAILK